MSAVNTLKNIIKKTMKKLLAIGASIAMFATATPAFAAMNSSSISVTTTNSGTINNGTIAFSHSGMNIAGGSTGGNGGNGGSVLSAGSNNNGGAGAGDGGNGGNASDGGFVDTGAASADAGTENGLNGTDVDVQVPTDMNSSSAAVDTDNTSPANEINNLTGAGALSGMNAAAGSDGGSGGTGGTVDGGAGTFNNGGATSGRGGSGGTGGIGGTVRTGASTSQSGSINLLNTTIVRVRN
jgi:hypothetical protein